MRAVFEGTVLAEVQLGVTAAVSTGQPNAPILSASRSACTQNAFYSSDDRDMARGGCSCRDDDCSRRCRPAGCVERRAAGRRAGAASGGALRRFLPAARQGGGPCHHDPIVGTLPDRRITSQDANLLPTLASAVVSAVLDGTGAANWRLDGIRFESVSNGQGDVIVLQDSTNIYLDRILMVAGAYGQKRGFAGTASKLR